MPAKTTDRTSEDSDYPSWWDFDKDGEELEGAFLRAGQGFTQNGPRPFVVLDVDGTKRTLWLHHEVLRNQFAREVHRRPDKTIAAGERIRVRLLGARESASNAGRSYTNYQTDFLDGPSLSQADIFGPPPEAASPSEPPAETLASGPSDSIPF